MIASMVDDEATFGKRRTERQVSLRRNLVKVVPPATGREPASFLERAPITPSMKTTAAYDSAAGTSRSRKHLARDVCYRRLQKWVHFYRQQMERYPAHTGSYAEDVKALEAVAAELRWLQ